MSDEDSGPSPESAPYLQEFAPGSMVFDEGDDGRCIYVIQSGEVELTRLGADGRSIVARLGPGDFFGEMSAILDEKRTARARAIGTTQLLEIDSETLEAMCVERPEILIRVLRRVTHRLVDAERRLSALGLDDWLRPLVRSVVELAEERVGEAARVPGKLRTLADHAGLTMGEAHRALHQLLDRKLLRIESDGLQVPDLGALEACLAPGTASAKPGSSLGNTSDTH